MTLIAVIDIYINEITNNRKQCLNTAWTLHPSNMHMILQYSPMQN